LIDSPERRVRSWSRMKNFWEAYPRDPDASGLFVVKNQTRIPPKADKCADLAEFTC
jgi:hypothetical protein